METTFKDKIDKGLSISFQKLLDHKIRNGYPMIISKDGKIIRLYQQDMEKIKK